MHPWGLPYPLHGRSGGTSHALCPLQPSLWLRYVDDTFVIWPHGEQELQSFHAHLNQMAANINTIEKKEERTPDSGIQSPATLHCHHTPSQVCAFDTG